MNKFFIYTLTDPRDNSIRYVGRTANPKARLTAHINSIPSKGRVTNEGEAKSAWVGNLQSNGLLPIMSIIDEADCKEDCAAKESLWIDRYLNNGCDLLNSQMPNVENPRRPYMKARQIDSDTAEKKTFVAGIRLTPTQAKKLNHMAEMLRVKPNTVIGMLIDSAKIVNTSKVEATAAEDDIKVAA